jgi:hypothetical protein
MKTTLFLNDETAQARLLLQNAALGETTVRKPEAVAGCTCDRWGHPCAACTEHKVQGTTNLLPMEE